MWQRSCMVGGGLLLVHYGGSSAVGSAVKTAIEAADRHIIGTDITMKSCTISLLQGRVQINGLAVHNPPGFPERPLLSVKKAVFDLGMLGLFLKNSIIIEELVFEGLNVDVEYDAEGVSNCTWIQDYLSERLTALHLRKEPDESPIVVETPAVPAQVQLAGDAQKRPIEFRKVQVTDVQATRGWASCALGDIRYDNFTDEVGASCVDDIAVIVMSSVMKSVAMNATGILHRVASRGG